MTTNDVRTNGTLLRGVYQTAYRLTVTQDVSFYSPKQRSLLIYDSGRILSNVSVNILYDGPSLRSDTRYTYTIQYWSSTGAISEIFSGQFRTALNNPKDELTGEWIGSRAINMNELRREFYLPQNVLAATVFMSGMGYGTLYINGQNVDPSRRLDPGWTTYTQRVLYVSYNVTQLLAGQSKKLYWSTTRTRFLHTRTMGWRSACTSARSFWSSTTIALPTEHCTQ